MGRAFAPLIMFCVVAGCALAGFPSGAQPAPAPRPQSSTTASTQAQATTADSSAAEFAEIRGHAGFWRIARGHDGVWWFLSPQNKTEFLNGVTTVRPRLRSREILGSGYRSSDWDGRVDDASLSDWARKTAERVSRYGFKSLGAWCDQGLSACGIPITRDLNVSRWAAGDVPFLGPLWRKDAERAIREQVIPLRSNRDLVGYYIDNELDWENMPEAAEPYFRITTSLIRKYDPNHLVLGCRYRGWIPAGVARGARIYTDAQSLNYYAADGLLDWRVFSMIAQESQQPLIISEYSFHALDGRSGNANRSHFPGQVRSQAARAAGYWLMTQRLAQVPYVIGADWFQWMDEPPAGRIGDGEDANVGVVDTHDRPYQQLVDAVRETTSQLNGLHAASHTSRNQLVWRTAPGGSHAPTALAGTAQELLSN
jgi:hypothetical protein